MGANLLPAAAQQQADTAGQTTNIDTAEPNPGAVAPVQATEMVFHDLDLGGIVSGGLHPENVLATVQRAVANTDLVTATDSIRGKLGGMVTTLGSNLAPGPAGGSNAATQILGQWPNRLLGVFHGGSPNTADQTTS